MNTDVDQCTDLHITHGWYSGRTWRVWWWPWWYMCREIGMVDLLTLL